MDPRGSAGFDRGVGDRSDDGEPAEDEPDDRIEPGRPSAENVLFVLLGALAALYVIARVAGLV